jgi:uncharacterized protein (DUF2252 family)
MAHQTAPKQDKATGTNGAAKARPGVHRHPTPAERTATGRDARTKTSRSAQATWQPPADRTSPVGILRKQDESRLQELVPIRYGRMLVSPFTFYRGAAAVMAADLGSTPTAGLRVQLCGDAHLSNFGLFASPERDLVFDINDFDETAPGPFEWDVKRLAASIEIAGRDRGFDDRERQAAVVATVGEYRGAIRRFAGMRDLDVWYAKLDVGALLTALKTEGFSGKKVAKAAAKAHTKDSMKAMSRLTHEVDGVLRIVGDPPLIVPLEDLINEDNQVLVHEMRKLVDAYKRTLGGAARRLMEQYHYADMARKVVGVGSVGTRCWIILLLGRDNGDPLFLQVKEAGESVLEPYAGKGRYSNHGRRVVEGQWLMQSASDILLGWLKMTGIDGQQRDFYLRQLWDWKRSAEIETFAPADLQAYGRICGWSLALGHARSGDALALAGYLGRGATFDLAMATFADSYADQNQRDYELLSAAAAAGEIEVTSGL